jgi:hypothetical protein
MSKLRILTALVCASALVACEKNAVQNITQPTSGAFVRFQNYGVNVPGVNFYANDQKLTAISAVTCTPSTDPRCVAGGIESTTGVAYGASANGGNYSMLAAGQYTLTGRIAAATDNGLAVATMSTTLADGKFYSYILSGIYNATTKQADGFIIEDALPTTFDYTKAYVRIVNASVNAPSIGVTTKLQGTTNVVTVGTSVAYKSASPIVTIEPGLTDFTVTAPGQPPVTFIGFNAVGGHVFTLALRGDATSTTATGLTITGTANR